jgi:hypothetical protein
VLAFFTKEALFGAMVRFPFFAERTLGRLFLTGGAEIFDLIEPCAMIATDSAQC